MILIEVSLLSAAFELIANSCNDSMYFPNLKRLSTVDTPPVQEMNDNSLYPQDFSQPDFWIIENPTITHVMGEP
jgi:hypothetical protein